MNFFIVSAGEPGSSYVENNFKDILNSNEFALHPNTKQKGTYYSIQPGDILILKYHRTLVAYGIVVRRYTNESKEFTLRVEVEEWIMHDKEYPGKGISFYGIQNATIGGGTHGTVKTVKHNFGLQKIKEINDAHPIYDEIFEEQNNNKINIYKNEDILNLHEEILNLLLEHLEINPDFRFRLRKTNRSNRLEEGFWFLGNEQYLSLGFWTGNDWRTKAPNISFVVDYEGNCWLNFSATDTDDKFNFLLNKIFPALEIKIREKDFIEKGGKYNIRFEGINFKECLNEFLLKYWPIIDSLVRKQENNSELYINKNNELIDNRFIRIIDADVFYTDLNKILFYKDKRDRVKNELFNVQPLKIGSFIIENYRSIIKTELINIPKDSQWIFLTGENGVGKSNIIKALARTIGYGRLELKETENIQKFDCKISEYGIIEDNPYFHRRGNIEIGNIKPIFLGFAAYGPLRMNPIYGELSDSKLKEVRSKNGHSNTLFSSKAYLLDLESQFEEWYSSPNNQEFAKRSYAIKEFLEGLLLNVGEINFGVDLNGVSTTLFREKDGDDKLFPPVGIQNLSSGYMSLLAMMSDLLVRLYRQQPEIDDPGELRGVVFIDEIDIHLHPKFQKHFVEQLTAAFPKVQFIATTHSPIPLLGAPKNSVICVVKRNVEKGTYIERVDDKIYFQDLLPNSILTSPIFNMDKITNIDRDKSKMIRTEKTFEELKFVDKLEMKINEFMTDEKEQQLIKLFEERRK